MKLSILPKLISHFRTNLRLKYFVGFWYHPDYVIPSLERTGRTLGVVAERGKQVLSFLAKEKIIKPGDIHPSPRARYKDLLLFHPHTYLEEVTHPEPLGQIFGLAPQDIKPDKILLSQRRAVGGTLSATQWVLEKRLKIGLNLGGGFHHAEPELGAGFCVYNDIAVTIQKIRKKGFKDPIAIVDLDYHQGNGNTVGFAEDDSVGVYSLHGAVWTHMEGKNDFNFELPDKTENETYLKKLKSTLPKYIKKMQPKLIFYIAGNDVLAGDPMGTFELTSVGVLKRDQYVVQLALSQNIPLVITLAGGYSPEACQCTLNLMLFLLGQKRAIRCRHTEELHQHFEKIAASLDPIELQSPGEIELSFSEADLFDFAQPKVQPKLLEFYSKHGLELALERYGVLQKIRDQGYQRLRISIDTSDPSHQLLRIEGRRKGSPKNKLQTLVEVVLLLKEIRDPRVRRQKSTWKFLFVEWLLLQDPHKKFSIHHPKFPGQEYPGLSIASEAEELFIQACQRLGLDGVMMRPSYFHIALGEQGEFHFLDPVLEGHLLAMKEVLKNYSLYQASQIVEQGELVFHNQQKVVWEPGDQILALSENVKKYFASKNYLQKVQQSKKDWLQLGLKRLV